MADDIKITPSYSGPHELPTDVAKALHVLATTLVLEHSESQTHSVLRTDNLDRKICVEATAIYLVSAIAQSIEANLTIREVLFDEDTLAWERP